MPGGGWAEDGELPSNQLQPTTAYCRARAGPHAQSVGNTALFSVECLSSAPQHTRKSFQAPELQGGQAKINQECRALL